MTNQHEQAAMLSGRWLWLFPASHAVHIAREGLAGEHFYRWIHRVIGREISARTFIGLNFAYEGAMIAAVRRARDRDNAGWIAQILGTITAVNGIGHLVGSVATQSYSPGLVSGLAVWTPLGLFAVMRARRFLPRAVWRRSIAAGAAINGHGRRDSARHGRSRRWLGPGAGRAVASADRGGIARKAAVIDERVEPRDPLNLTVAFDHDVVDGAPAARFVRRLVHLIEGGYGLEEDSQDSCPSRQLRMSIATNNHWA